MGFLYIGEEFTEVERCCKNEEPKMFVLEILQRRVMTGMSCHGHLGRMEKKGK